MDKERITTIVIPDKLYREVKKELIDRDCSLKEFMIEIITKELKGDMT